MLRRLLARTWIFGTVMGALIAPLDAVEPCQCAKSSVRTAACKCCGCCKAVVKSTVPVCCQRRSCCQKAVVTTSARHSLRCCCRHGDSPAVPQSPLRAEFKLQQVLSVSPPVLKLGVPQVPRVLDAESLALAPPTASTQSLLCRWTI